MTNFEIEISDDIEATAWLELDPFNNQKLCDIYLCVDWEKQEVYVETQYGNNTDYRTYMHLRSEYRISEQTDASQFKEYYDTNIKPLVLEQAEHFESYWDGHNWKGKFVEMVGVENENEYGYDEYGYDEYVGNDYEITLQLEGAPEHEKYIYFDVAESFLSYKDIVDMLKYADIVFMTVDLEDVVNVKAIREYLSDDVVYLMSDDQFRNDLISMRETMQEEEGEAE